MLWAGFISAMPDTLTHLSTRPRVANTLRRPALGSSSGFLKKPIRSTPKSRLRHAKGAVRRNADREPNEFCLHPGIGSGFSDSGARGPPGLEHGRWRARPLRRQEPPRPMRCATRIWRARRLTGSDDALSAWPEAQGGRQPDVRARPELLLRPSPRY